METILLICAIMANNGHCNPNFVLAVYCGDDGYCECREWTELEVKKVTPYDLLKDQKEYKGCIVVNAEEYLEIK